MSALIARLKSHASPHGWLLAGAMGLLVLCVVGYLAFDSIALLGLPFGLIALMLGMKDYRWVYLAIWATIPFSIEMDLPGGLSTDFPAEPLMWASCLLLPFFLFLRYKSISHTFIYHPLFLLLFLHLIWIIITAVISTTPLISFKYTLAKGWYLICFILIPLLLFRDMREYKTWAWVILIPIVITVLIILYRHSTYDFTFSTINNAVIPIYRNHVDYACCLGLVLPIVWYMRLWYDAAWIRWLLTGAMAILLTGIYFSYTRAAWVCVPLAFIVWGIIRWRLMRVVIPLALAGGIMIVAWFAHDNRYIQYAPNYEKTITHQHFDDLVSATVKLEDISTVERFYRWVAGVYMIAEKPLTGYGPASFYSVYHSYVDRHFTTYVSDNPEKSGMHNYYLMVAVEQGLIGLGIFLALVIAVLLMGEQLYHRMPAGEERQFLMAMLISFTANLFIQTLNDTVETDKLGTFFFLSIAVVIGMGMKYGVFTAPKSPDISTPLNNQGDLYSSIAPKSPDISTPLNNQGDL